MINQISTSKQVKEGFWQNYFIDDKFEILVSVIRQGVSLDEHSHIHHQFGYCLNGEFSFHVSDEVYTISKGSYYILQGSLLHGATALTDFSAIDIKYIQNTDITVAESVDIILIEGQVTHYALGSHNVFQCKPKSVLKIKRKLNKKYYCIAAQNCQVGYNGEKFLLESMSIQEFGGEDSSITLSCNDTLFIIERQV